MFTLENLTLSVGYDPERGVFSVQAARQPFYFIEAGRMSVTYRRRGERFHLLRDGWRIEAGGEIEMVVSPHGPLRQARLSGAPDDNGLACALTFAIAEREPLMLWKIAVENRGNQPVEMLRLNLLEAGRGVPGSRVTLTRRGLARPAFLSNSWQSWTYSAVYPGDQAARLPLVDALVDRSKLYNPDTPRPRQPGHYGSDLFGVIGDRLNRTGWLVGFLAQRAHFGSVEAWTDAPAGVRLWANGDGARLDPGERMESDWAALQPVDLDDPDPLGAYMRAAARENDCAIKPGVPVGWCSWYYYYQHLDEEDIRANLDALARVRGRLPVELMQIDDGFERQIGDWYDFAPGFPRGVAPLAQKTRAAGLTPGLWLAPFLVHPASRLAKEHPEYILRNGFGRPSSAGLNWNVWTYGMDLTRPDVLEYTRGLIKTMVKDWGFPYLKLDFLYAGALPGRRHDPRLTRAQALRQGLGVIREAAGPETYLLGCGLPLGPALGLFDAMRIGADVGSGWTPELFGTDRLLRSDPNLPCVRNAVQNTLARSAMHGRWWVNDPDCLLVRPDSKLTLAEVRSWASLIAMTGGSVLLSDDLPALPDERLRIAEVLLPVLGRRAEVLDWFDRETPQYLKLDCGGPEGEWYALAWFNWSDESCDFLFRPGVFNLPAGEWWLRSFWDGRVERLSPGQMVTFADVPPHGAVLLAARQAGEGEPRYLGGDLHVMQGVEVAGWQVDGSGVTLKLTLPRACSGVVDVALPRPPAAVWMDGKEITWQALGAGVYQISLAFEGQSEIHITC